MIPTVKEENAVKILLTPLHLHVKLSCYRVFIENNEYTIQLKPKFIWKGESEMWNWKLSLIIALALFTCGAESLPEIVAQTSEGVSISSPTQDEVLTGVVPIFGTSEIIGFVHAEVAFAYGTDSPNTWFPISNSDMSVKAGLLTNWDTTTITDGDYKLRLRVILEDDSIQEFVISHVFIRNYAHSETSSPTATPVLVFPSATIPSSTITPVVLPTDLPENPLVLSPKEIITSVIYGFVVIIGLIIISSIYSRWQHK
ncbi:MAG: hypothetical protein A2X25_10760 [Chloroflexi bacterium GWB2_49_20]|nr:MAG: hypothetical protein A2X25_10760 [Chloroflexi bacterium GWB2_49_20]OGN78962.1 MAG: hypothetical protein A2X26_00595 [Chloroflexi bacterium GWC2_49_37]OGN86277.1 MAG: hypothetical protein A2X27_05185 [Chloroflexi bacterium GWD2_49_16]